MSGSNWITAAFEETFNLPYRQFHKPNVQIPSFWGTLAHHDLRQYAHLAVLPEMELSPAVPPPPTPPHRGHRNRLHVEHEPYRRLDFIYNISFFAETALEFCLTKLPSTRTGDADFDSENGGGITVAARGFQINSPMPIGKPSDIDKVLRWVIEYPLATINHMMHLVHPETVDYILQEGRNDGHDNALIRWAYWGRDENTITEALDTWSESVMVFIQPPWILTQADMEAFVGCPTFPAPNSQKKLKSYERLWGKIWDLCTQKHSHWFVLTTYWGWVFGAFSSGSTRVWVSQIIPFDSKEPTVLQCLFFWFTSAVASQLPQQDTWVIPEVPEPVHALEHISIPVHDDSVDTDVSESSWQASSGARTHSHSGFASDGESDDEADADTVMFELLPDMLRNAAPPTGPRQIHNANRIEAWKLDLGAGQHPHALNRAPPAPPSEAPSNTTINSVSTVVDQAQGAQRHGEIVTAVRGEMRLDYNHGGMYRRS